MTVDPTTMGVIGTTFSAFFVGLFGWLGVREKRTREIAEKADDNIETLRDELDEQRHRLDIAIGHIYELRRYMVVSNIEPPALPVELVPKKHLG